MIPGSTTAVVLFLIFLTPGLVFEWVAERKRPTRKVTPLRETGRIIVVSTAASVFGWGATAVVFNFMRWVRLAKLQDDPAGYFADRTLGVVLALVVALAVSWALAAGAAYRLVPSQAAKVHQQPALWQGLFVNVRPGEPIQALATMRDGSMIMGIMEGIDIGDAEENPYLVISRPKLGRAGAQVQDSGFHRVFVQLADVRELWTRSTRPRS